jgi:hypothetical protein
MDKKEIIKNLNYAINEISNWNINYFKDANYDCNNLKVLKLLKIDIENNGLERINDRILRGFKDVCTDIAIHWEDYSFYDPIFKIYDEFDKRIPIFKDLDLLRMDFGKGYPI